MTIKELEELKAIEQEKWEAYEEWESKQPWFSEVRYLEEQAQEIEFKIRNIRDQHNFYDEGPFADWIKAKKAADDYKEEYFARACFAVNQKLKI